MISSVLSKAQLITIHNTSLALLEQVGVVVPHAEVLARFAAAGAVVDHNTKLVKIPSDVVAKLLETAGRSFTLYGRDITKTAKFGVGERNYNSIAGEASWIDAVAGQRRYASLDDVATASRFGDALNALTMVGAMADPHEIPVSYRCVEVMATMLKHTTKPLIFWFHDRASAAYLLEIMMALRGSEAAAIAYPICYPLFEPISPLRFPFHGIDLLFETARFNLPVAIGPMAQMGLSAPATIAGTMAQQNAEILAGICITQLIRPGMPVCYGGICHAFDMKTTQMIFAGPEQAIFGVAMTQLGKYYGLPVYVNVGLTDAKRPDAQAGLEAGVTLMLAAAAGADIFGHLGISGVDQASSLDMLTWQHEIIQYVNSVMRDIEVSDETLGLDVVKTLGPEGLFIDSEHTARHFRKELYFPPLLDRQYYQHWLDAGGQSMEERCRQQKETLLRTHQPQQMAADIACEIDSIVARAKCDLFKAAGV